MKTVTLSTGEVAHLSEKWTRKAQREYNLALRAVYREGEDGKLEMPKEIELERFNIANEAALLVIIEKIEHAGTERRADQNWIDNLASEDFDALTVALHQIKSGKDKKKS